VSSIVLRGATEGMLDDVERAVDDGINAYKVRVSGTRHKAHGVASMLQRGVARRVRRCRAAAPAAILTRLGCRRPPTVQHPKPCRRCAASRAVCLRAARASWRWRGRLADAHRGAHGADDQFACTHTHTRVFKHAHMHSPAHLCTCELG
jgi:hypothetical protein